MHEEIGVFIGDSLKKEDTMEKHKYFVFDLDETIGSFSDLYLLCKILNIVQKDLNRSLFPDAIQVVDQLLDIFPEFLRPGIIDILYYIYIKKHASVCDGVFIYTNNQCIPETWTQHIINYIEKKGNMKNLVNNIVLTFKINERIIEPKRTTQNKVYREFIKCSYLPNKSSICFIDNASFKKMKRDCVYYIQPPSYFHTLAMNDIIRRFLTSDLGLRFTHLTGSSKNVLEEKMYATSLSLGRSNKSYQYKLNSVEQLSHIETSRKIMYYIREYLFYSNKKRRRTMSLRKKTLRKTRKISPGL